MLLEVNTLQYRVRSPTATDDLLLGDVYLEVGLEVLSNLSEALYGGEVAFVQSV